MLFVTVYINNNNTVINIIINNNNTIWLAEILGVDITQ